VFDALTQQRPYKPAWPAGDAIAEIDRQRGRQFDPALVDAFLRVIEQREQAPVATD
jgi:putative two-component system response regulator